MDGKDVNEKYGGKIKEACIGDVMKLCDSSPLNDRFDLKLQEVVGIMSQGVKINYFHAICLIK